MKPLIVQKYGGVTLETPQKIKAIAQRIATESKNKNIVAVVSAMGSTTNTLLELAGQVSRKPQRRELDMLLSVGERTSMALLSMALHDLGIQAISFTGSQAGIITDEDHVNARIVDVRPYRLQSALKNQQVVILAGFQGVTETTKEITTLGRGGTDVTAVAIAAALQADRCEILKEVPGVMSADPRIVRNAKVLPSLTYQQMSEMTFGGAKVVHFRAVELSKKLKVPLFVGSTMDTQNTEGTLIQGDSKMFEKCEFISINSHNDILEVETPSSQSLDKMLNEFEIMLEKNEIPSPLILKLDSSKKKGFVLTGPKEILEAIHMTLHNSNDFKVLLNQHCTVTLTGTGSIDFKTTQKVVSILNEIALSDYSIVSQSSSLTLLIPVKYRESTIKTLHDRFIGR